jgi:hypothetical protein
MKPSEILADFPIGPGDIHTNALFLRIALRYLADHVEMAELENGDLLHDVTDFRQWLQQLAAAKPGESSPGFGNHRLRSTGRVLDCCPRCGHVHHDQKECGEEIGPGKTCGCVYNVQVSA